MQILLRAFCCKISEREIVKFELKLRYATLGILDEKF